MAQAQRLDAFDISFDREADGRWIAEAAGLPGALAYGDSRHEAEMRVRELALRILADRIAHHEPVPEFVARLFRAS